VISFTERVYAAVKKIPAGRVSTYKEVARALGVPGACRAVGNALNKNRSRQVPCHRVVKSDGSLGGFARGAKEKKRLLEREGVRSRAGRVEGFETVFFRLT